MHGLNHDPLIIQQVVSSKDHDDLLMMTAEHQLSAFKKEYEFRNQYLLLDQNIQLPKNLKTAPILPTEDLPETYDWREYDAVTEVKDQGECGCCWAFAAIATLETAHFMSKSNLVELSEQQLVDCSDDGECGCCWAFAAIATLETGHFMSKNAVIEPDEDQFAANLVNYSTIAVQINEAMTKLTKVELRAPMNARMFSIME
ncbi:hypothetical protein LWI28_011868 [Acer negundo]|uniref:Peptidase C1A papain C-terminal domain-containing protein n=1 Tax=Acer negundo TaxID=4023 RepID=A0AAD5JWB7_ACENE|nr:hypothetical protein LWI28_011868 [Acer negundo]